MYVVFVNFSNAFDTVGRTGLWQLLRKCGCPKKFTTMIEALHTGMMANVNVAGEISEAFRDTGGGVYIQYRRSADLFNVAHLRAKTKTTRKLVGELLFANYSALKIQWSMAKASASFGRLLQRLWNNHHVSMRVKDKIYRAIVLPTLLYGTEVWTVKRLHAFMVRHLRSTTLIGSQAEFEIPN